MMMNKKKSQLPTSINIKQQIKVIKLSKTMMRARIKVMMKIGFSVIVAVESLMLKHCKNMLKYVKKYLLKRERNLILNNKDR
jgi:hypothetical protein